MSVHSNSQPLTRNLNLYKLPTMPSITFYHVNGACSFGLHAFLRELNIPFTPIQMKYLPEGGHESRDGTVSREAYLNIHHSGYVPALVTEDGQAITENPAIFTYVALLAGPERGEKLLGGSPLGRTRVTEWMSWLSGTLHGYGYGMFFKPSRFSDDRGRDEEIRDKGRALIRKAYARIEKALGEGSFFVGEEETVVDFYALIFWNWGQRFGFEMKDNYPNYTRLVDRMELKESVRKAAKEEKVTLSSTQTKNLL